MTVYAFSTENWQREPAEVNALMDLLRHYLDTGFKELQENNARIIFIGERHMLAADILKKMTKIEEDTAQNSDVTLCGIILIFKLLVENINFVANVSPEKL
jgi:undecaprenyl diphosphate synthase